MPLHKGWALQDDATRVGALALRAAREKVITAPGMTKNLYRHLSGMICWDAAMMCAWLADAIDINPPLNLSDIERRVYHYNTTPTFNIVDTQSYNNLFTRPIPVNTVGAALSMQIGSFIGFVNAQNGLKHVMLYCGNGLAAGTNNGCIYDPLPTGGWEVLDLIPFFTSHHIQSGTRMIHTPIWGQTIRRT
jgi:hypothetical protein